MEDDYQRNAMNGGDDEDSFFAQAKNEEDEQKPSDEEGDKHRFVRPKKKHINKKKDKSSKPAKKTYTNKEKEKELRLYMMGERKADEIMEKMQFCFEKDKELVEKRKLACQKLNYLEELGKQLSNIYVSEKFIEKDGLNLFERWLEKVTVGEESFEPSVSIRKGVFEILLSLVMNTENVSKTNEIQRLVARQKRSQVKQLRELSEKIILKWNKLAYESEQ